MGMYTDFLLDVRFRPETPERVVRVIEMLFKDELDPSVPLPDHPLFAPTDEMRWKDVLFGQSLCNFELSALGHWTAIVEEYGRTHRPNRPLDAYVRELDRDADGFLRLRVVLAQKNYDGQFERFLHWIAPWVLPGVEGEPVAGILREMTYAPIWFYANGDGTYRTIEELEPPDNYGWVPVEEYPETRETPVWDYDAGDLRHAYRVLIDGTVDPVETRDYSVLARTLCDCRLSGKEFVLVRLGRRGDPHALLNPDQYAHIGAGAAELAER